MCQWGPTGPCLHCRDGYNSTVRNQDSVDVTMQPLGVGHNTAAAGSRRVLLRGSPTTRAAAGVANFTALQLQVRLI